MIESCARAVGTEDAKRHGNQDPEHEARDGKFQSCGHPLEEDRDPPDFGRRRRLIEQGGGDPTPAESWDLVANDTDFPDGLRPGARHPSQEAAVRLPHRARGRRRTKLRSSHDRVADSRKATSTKN